MNIRSTSKENFLQLYTPDRQNIVAIEPMTGATDNFNNKIGLQTLQPNETYHVKWSIAIEPCNTHTNQLINYAILNIYWIYRLSGRNIIL